MTHGSSIAASVTIYAFLLVGCSPVDSSRSAPITEIGTVVAVVDGDTIDVETATGTARVRLIGIDTPEIGRDGADSECFALEARDFLDDRLYGREVELVSDHSQGDVDVYGRELRQVLVDGEDAALASISAGMGVEYTYDVPYVGREAYKSAEAAARDAQVGLWNACN